MNYKYATIIFNGEIYNYIELKKYLKKKGYNFQTNPATGFISLLHSLG